MNENKTYTGNQYRATKIVSIQNKKLYLVSIFILI